MFGSCVQTFLLEDKHQSFKDVVSNPVAPYWKEAINSEIESIMQNHTWELVDLSSGCKPLGCKWIFKRKMKADGSIAKYKAMLVVVKGYTKGKLRLFWHIFTSYEDSIHSNVNCNCCYKQFQNTSNGCKNNFLKWWIKWGWNNQKDLMLRVKIRKYVGLLNLCMN